MKVHYKGRIDNIDAIPHRDHSPGAIKLNTKGGMNESKTKYMIILLALFLPIMLYAMIITGPIWMLIQLFIGAVLYIPMLILSAKLQAQLIKSDCDIYLLKNKGLSVILNSDKEMTRNNFVVSMLVPLVVMVPIPYAIALLLAPAIGFVGFAIAFLLVSSLSINCRNAQAALRQIPKDAMIYMHGLDVFWYIPSYGVYEDEVVFRDFKETHAEVFCSFCGNKNLNGSRLCNVCGSKLYNFVDDKSGGTVPNKLKRIQEVVSFAPLTQKQIEALNMKLK